MKKQIVFFSAVMLCITILFSIYYANMHSKTYLPEATLEKSFANSGAKVVASEIYVWANYNEDGDAEPVFRQVSENLAKALDVVKNEAYSSNSTENDEVNKVEINGLTSEGKIVNISYQTPKVSGGGNESHIYLKVSEDLTAEGLEELRTKASKVFKASGLNPKINSCITGSFDGKLEYAELNQICNEIFKVADARKVEGMRDERLISVAAYSPVIDDFIKVNDKKVNLNLAVRYNSYEDKTYIWLATPVITTEY